MPCPKNGVPRSRTAFRDGFLAAFFPADFKVPGTRNRGEVMSMFAKFRKLRFYCRLGPWPRNDLGVIVGEPENFVAGGNVAGDCAARTRSEVGKQPLKNSRP